MSMNTTASQYSESCSALRFLGAYLVLIWILGTFLNGSILVLFARYKKLQQSSTNVLISGLLLADFFGALVATPFPAVSMLQCRWLFGSFGCIFQSVTAFFTGCSNMYMLCVISIDRYIVVTRSISAPIITAKQAVTIILAVYTFVFIWTMLPVLGWSKYDFEGARVSCSIKWEDHSANALSFTLTILLCVYLIPVLIIITTNVRVYRMIHERRRCAESNLNEPHARRQSKIERRIAHTVIFIITGFIVAWTPYALTVIIRIIIFPRTLSPLIGTALGAVAKSSIIWNPLIYAVRNRNFRNYLPFLTSSMDRERKASDPTQYTVYPYTGVSLPLTSRT